MPNRKGIVGLGLNPAGRAPHNTTIPKLADWHAVLGEQQMHNLERLYRDENKWSAGAHLFVADDL